MPNVGDPVRYRAMAGDVYDAEIAGIRADGTLDVNVTCRPPTDDRLFLSRVRLDETRAACAWPKEER